jgi:ribonucleoside-diphosphate reductase alpha chain
MNNDREDLYWANDDSRTFLGRGYLLEDETIEQRIEDIGNAVQVRFPEIEGLGERVKEHLRRGRWSLSSPIWANILRERGLPISCFGSYIPDSMAGILGKAAEVGMMTKHGGGTSAYFGDVRPRGAEISDSGHSTGSVHFMQLFDTLMDVVSQGNVRRGSFAAYLPIEHPDLEEFLSIGEEHSPIKSISIGVTVSREFVQKVRDKDKKAGALWVKVIKKRFESGYPYIFFTDNVADGRPQWYKDQGFDILASNLCTEIMLPSTKDLSFVCDLLSINLDQWDEIEDSLAIEDAVYMLDAVMSEFIEKTEGIEFMEPARKFAMEHRALGIGVLGWHSYLQSKNIAFESMDAKLANNHIWSIIKERTYKASREMAELYGEPEALKGYGMRHATTMAVAPTTSSSFILGQVSPSIEPLNSNYFIKDLAKGKFVWKNPHLIELLDSKSKNTAAVWKDILLHGGSVQHLEFLTDHEKDVYKTFGETSQKDIIIQAAQRQRYIDQGQSLNLMIPPETSVKDVNALLLFAEESGIKTLYYQRSSNPAQQLARSILACPTCEA